MTIGKLKTFDKLTIIYKANIQALLGSLHVTAQKLPRKGWKNAGYFKVESYQKSSILMGFLIFMHFMCLMPALNSCAASHFPKLSTTVPVWLHLLCWNVKCLQIRGGLRTRGSLYIKSKIVVP